jgi:hypothetical protein
MPEARDQELVDGVTKIASEELACDPVVEVDGDTITVSFPKSDHRLTRSYGPPKPRRSDGMLPLQRWLLAAPFPSRGKYATRDSHCHGKRYAEERQGTGTA